MKKFFMAVLVTAMVSVNFGCALLISGKTQQVTFDSNPAKADVYVDGSKAGVTPCVVIMHRSKMPPKVEIKKEGYDDARVAVASRLNYWVIANIIGSYSSTTSTTVDMLVDDGAATVEYDPNRYFTTLERSKDAGDEDTGSIDEDRPHKSKRSQERAEEKVRSKTLRFVVVNYNNLVIDISRGQGEALSTLYELLGVKPEQQGDALQKLKGLYIKCNDAVEFGRAIEISFPRPDGGTKTTP